jgi:enamine deaminase RidA (YjgF/YER057c/UK114 family)
MQRQILQNLSAVLTAAGSSIENAVKVNIFLTSMDNYKAMNDAYADFFPDPKPVGLVSLPVVRIGLVLTLDRYELAFA